MDASRAEPWRRRLFLLGLALSALLAARAQTGGDQLNLLARGWLLVERGILVPYGNPLSSGGVEPGPLTTLLVGLPLFLWRDQKAAVALVVLFHILAYVLLDRTLAKMIAPRERLLFALVYWLNPWRLHYSGFLWNPNFLFLPAAAHFATAWEGRGEARFWPSLLHVLALGAAFELHPSALILGLISLLLVWRRSLKLDGWGVLVGIALVAISLLPWTVAVDTSTQPLLPGGKGFFLRGLLYVFPLLRGCLYWLRYGSLYLSGAVLRLNFVDLAGPGSAGLARILGDALTALLPLTVALPLWANARFLRRVRGRSGRRRETARPRAWLRDYVLAALIAATLSFALSPTTVMPWQALIVFQAAVLPLVFLGGGLWRLPRFAKAVRAAAIAWALAATALGLTLAAGSRYYRCSGPLSMGVGVALRHDHPMFHDLGLSESCPPSFDAELGWWPDTLPEN